MTEPSLLSAPHVTALLNWKVFVTPAVPTVSDDSPRRESPYVVTDFVDPHLRGARRVLVDTPTTAAQATALADRVEESGTTIYAPHGHGDHFFGNGTLLERFPGAKADTTRKVLEAMRKQTSPQVMEALWRAPPTPMRTPTRPSPAFWAPRHRTRSFSCGARPKPVADKGATMMPAAGLMLSDALYDRRLCVPLPVLPAKQPLTS